MPSRIGDLVKLNFSVSYDILGFVQMMYELGCHLFAYEL